jgi:hypothetical protein
MAHAPGSVLKPLVKIGRTPADCWSWLGKIDELGCAIKQFDGKPMISAPLDVDAAIRSCS